MRVFLQPTGLFSRAMVRIANALTRYAPPGVTITKHRNHADLVVMYVIGLDAVKAAAAFRASGQRYAVVQCCRCADQIVTGREWHSLWKGAAVVMSYYDMHDLASDVGFRFYHSPLGADPAFVSTLELDPAYARLDTREPSVITCGYVSSPHAEPIEEVWIAAASLGIPVAHIGPQDVKGITRRFPNVTCLQPSDEDLVKLYLRAKWVAALRHTEGFEMPAVEALVCGARPLLFSQPALHYWYGDLATYLPDVSGQRLVEKLVAVLGSSRPVTQHERYRARARFDWAPICEGFWRHVELSAMDGTGPPKVTASYYRAKSDRAYVPEASFSAYPTDGGEIL